MSLSWPTPVSSRTLTGITLTPEYATPAMPVALSVAAAAMLASHVPWPLTSALGSAPAIAEYPGTMIPVRSAFEASTPVSRTAMVAEPAGLTDPKAVSHPIFGSAHWSGYEGSDGIAAALRAWSTSTLVTCGSDLYLDSCADTALLGTLMTCIRRLGIENFSVPPSRATTLCWSALERPWASSTMSEVVAAA